MTEDLQSNVWINGLVLAHITSKRYLTAVNLQNQLLAFNFYTCQNIIMNGRPQRRIFSSFHKVRFELKLDVLSNLNLIFEDF